MKMTYEIVPNNNNNFLDNEKFQKEIYSPYELNYNNNHNENITNNINQETSSLNNNKYEGQLAPNLFENNKLKNNKIKRKTNEEDQIKYIEDLNKTVNDIMLNRNNININKILNIPSNNNNNSP